MCDKKSCGFILAKIAAKQIPPWLVLGWHTSVLEGYDGGLGRYIEEVYTLYLSRCKQREPDRIEEWLMNSQGDGVLGTDWKGRRKEATDEFIR